MQIERLEQRWKKYVGGEDIDFSIFPNESDHRPDTNKSKSGKHGEVFTPMWLVDHMLSKKISELDTWKIRTLDLCAGYGQFSIRLCRALHNKFPDFNLNQFLQTYHWFSEIQIDSVIKIQQVFGMKINLLIGDAKFLTKLSAEDTGIFRFDKQGNII